MLHRAALSAGVLALLLACAGTGGAEPEPPAAEPPAAEPERAEAKALKVSAGAFVDVDHGAGVVRVLDADAQVLQLAKRWGTSEGDVVVASGVERLSLGWVGADGTAVARPHSADVPLGAGAADAVHARGATAAVTRGAEAKCVPVDSPDMAVSLGSVSRAWAGPGYCCGQSEAGLQCEAAGGDPVVRTVSGLVAETLSLGVSACAVQADRSLRCFAPSTGELDGLAGNTPEGTGYRDVSVSADTPRACAVDSDGALQCWSDQAGAVTMDVPGAYQRVSVDGNQVCAVRDDGALVCFRFPGA